ncbi:hypothetical protein EDD16DRAFT_1723864 [Pisolithus croceorrhizus]|nr:hypothetical protein EDD16DRAFT_1723864 [Pisolithus croceorrhizus]
MSRKGERRGEELREMRCEHECARDVSYIVWLMSSRGCTSARSERFGAELHELRPKRGRSQEGGIASVRNRWVETYETPGGDGDARGELGERGIVEKSAPVPEISAKPSHTPLSTEKTHISTTVEHIGMKRVSPGSHKPVEPPCKKARGSTRK